MGGSVFSPEFCACAVAAGSADPLSVPITLEGYDGQQCLLNWVLSMRSWGRISWSPRVPIALRDMMGGSVFSPELCALRSRGRIRVSLGVPIALEGYDGWQCLLTWVLRMCSWGRISWSPRVPIALQGYDGRQCPPFWHVVAVLALTAAGQPTGVRLSIRPSPEFRRAPAPGIFSQLWLRLQRTVFFYLLGTV